MKRLIINLYCDMLMGLEDFFGEIETTINRHRKRVDEKFWTKYLS